MKLRYIFKVEFTIQNVRPLRDSLGDDCLVRKINRGTNVRFLQNSWGTIVRVVKLNGGKWSPLLKPGGTIVRMVKLTGE